MLQSLGRVVRNRPRSTLLFLALLVVVFGAVAGIYGYAFHQLRVAETAIKNGHPAEAQGPLAFCLKVLPRSTKVHLLAARAARMLGDYPTTEMHLNTCRKLENGSTEAIQLEFLLLRAQTGEVDEVSNQLWSFIDNKHPDSVMIMETIANAFIHQLRYGPAHDCLTRWIQEEPDNARPLHFRGWVLERLDDHKDAMIDYQKALELDPGLFAVRLRVAEMLLEDKLPLEAVPHLERLRKQAPDNPEVLVALGQCRYLQGELQEAGRLLERVEKEAPDNLTVLLYMAKLEELDLRPVEAERRLRRLLEKDTANTEALLLLASVLRAQDRTEEAKAALDQFEQMKVVLESANRLLRNEAEHPTKDPAAAFEIGDLMLKMGQERVGTYWLSQALKRDPEHLPTHRALAEYYEKKGDLPRAAEHRRKLTDLAKTARKEGP